MTKRIISWGFLLAFIAISLTSCTSSTSEKPGAKPGEKETSSAKSAGTALTKAGVSPGDSDTLMLTYPNDPDTLNLITASDTVSEEFHRWVYEGLAERQYDDPDKFEPKLATHWEFDKENLEYTIHLRKGVQWHPMTLPDGTPLPKKEVTTADVKFTFDCILNPNVEAAALRSYYEDSEAKDASERYRIKVTVVDDYTIKVRWTKPYFLSEEWTVNIPVLPRHVYSVDEKGEPISFDYSSKEFADGFNNHWANTKMCGTGPMMFGQWKRDERLVLERNPNYWGAPFYFSRVEFQCIPNPNTSLQMVLQGELDWSVITEKNQFLQSEDNKNVKAGAVNLKSYSYPGYRYIGYNVRRPFLNDKQVRLALGHAVPVETIIKQVFKGLAEPVNGPFQPGSSAVDPTIKALTFDLEKAKQLLDAAGWKDDDEDGIREKMVDGKKFPASYELIIFADSPSFLTIAEIIKDNSRKIGVDIKITPQKWALMLQSLRKKSFDACMLGWAMSWRQDPFQIWHGSQADLPESSNAIGYQNAEVDAAINELRTSLDPEKQVELYHRIHRLIFEDQPYTFLFSEKRTAGLNSRIEGVNFYKIRPCIDVRQWHANRLR